MFVKFLLTQKTDIRNLRIKIIQILHDLLIDFNKRSGNFFTFEGQLPCP